MVVVPERRRETKMGRNVGCSFVNALSFSPGQGAVR